MNIKECIKGILPKKKNQEPELRIRRTLTDSARIEAHQKLSDVLNEISKFEMTNNVKVLSSTKFHEEDYYDEDSIQSNRVEFYGVNKTNYTLPLAVFMAIPKTRIVLGVTRALMIGYNRQQKS